MNSVLTGDTASILPYVFLMAGAIIAIVGYILYQKKNKK